MTAPEMEAIIGGYHGDAFSVLGPHPINTDRTEWIIRAFLPQAKSAARAARRQSHTHGEEGEARQDGFLQRGTDFQPGAYRFEIEGWHGGTSVIEDPYRFPPIISEFDLYLHGEGTLYEGWHTWGAHLTTVEGVAGVRFAVWAPNAEIVSVTGDFNEWDARRHPCAGATRASGKSSCRTRRKAIPTNTSCARASSATSNSKPTRRGFRSEVPPKSASIVCDISTATSGTTPSG